MVAGWLVEETDKEPIILNDRNIEAVEEFILLMYLGSLIASSGRMDKEIDKQITLASRGFGASSKCVLLDKNLSLAIRRCVYTACVLSMLLYGAEC